ncbi:MAG TPA: ADOP family duplicated permease [Longimicrobiaceae bacterium]|jgi:predicted permease
MDALLQDLRYAARQAARAPGFSLLVVGVLALGIGANTALFTLGNALLLRPRPGVADPGRLVWVAAVREGHPNPLSLPDVRDFRERVGAFSALAAFHDVEVSVSGGSGPERVRGQLVTGEYFALLGAPVALGRGLSPADDDPAAPPAAVIGHGLWRRRFAGDPAVVGREIVVNGAPLTVVGVAGPGFNGADHDLPRDVWLPMSMAARALPGRPGLPERRDAWWVSAVGRLAPGASAAQADAALAAVARQIARDDPAGHRGVTARTYSAAAGLAPGALPEVMAVAGLGFAVTGVVLLIACANVGSLLLGRAVARRREIAVRLSLGAGRARVVRQLLTESVLLSLLAGGAGLLLAAWGTELLAARVELPPMELAPDGRVLAFCVAAAFVAGALFGVVPALDATRSDVAGALRSVPSGVDPRRARLQGRFVSAQVALSLVLLAAAGLFLRSMRAETGVEPGFEATTRVLALSFDLGLQGYSEARAGAFLRTLEERAAALPGVRSVSFADRAPLAGRPVGAEAVPGPGGGRPPEGGARGLDVFLTTVRPGYFRTLGIPLARGRDFTAADAPGAPGVVVVSEGFARAAWPGEDPVGRRLTLDGAGPELMVVGVAQESLVAPAHRRALPAVYLPQLQHPGARALTLLVRAEGDARPLADALRREVAALDRDLPVYRVQTLAQYRRESASEARTGAVLVGMFGGLALLLATVGLYGAMSFAVGQRTREIGVRVALGARGADVVRLFLRRGARLAATGMAVGLVLSLAAGRLLSGILYGVSPLDLPTLASAALLLGAAALLASYLPARRATRVEPMAALRAE